MDDLEQTKTSYFDPKSPQTPPEIFDVPTLPLIELSDSVRSILTYATGDSIPADTWLQINEVAKKTPDIIALMPLVERIQNGEQLTSADVAAYRKPIKKVVPKLKKIDTLTKLSSGVLVGVPLRRRLNRKVDQEFIERIPGAIDSANQSFQTHLPAIKSEVEFLASFENPRQQYISEIRVIEDAIKRSATERSLAQGHHEVSAEDAGYAIRRELGKLMVEKTKAQQDLPMLSHFISDRVPAATELPPQRMFSIAAPEIIRGLESTLPPEQQDKEFRNQIWRNPHPQRGLAEFWKGGDLYGLESALHAFSSIAKLLPETGEKLNESFQKLIHFLNSSPAQKD